MINLLPPQQKEEVLLRKYLALILVWEILIFAFLISFALTLSLVKIFINRDLIIEKIYLEKKEKEAFLSKDLEEKIKNFNFNFSQLNSFYQNQVSLTEILEKISQTIPPEVSLTNFNFSTLKEKEKEKVNQIFLSGFASNRELLLLFKKNLENQEEIFEINFSPESWISPTDINFNLSFKLK